MSTRSMVGYEEKNKKVLASYIHSDGYVKGVGSDLIKYANTPQKIKALVDGGARSTIKSTPYGDQEVETFRNDKEYIKDMGDEVNFLYLYKDKEWYVYDTYKGDGWKKVQDILSGILPENFVMNFDKLYETVMRDAKPPKDMFKKGQSAIKNIGKHKPKVKDFKITKDGSKVVIKKGDYYIKPDGSEVVDKFNYSSDSEAKKVIQDLISKGVIKEADIGTVKVGDIFYSKVGKNDTIIDFYEVVKNSGKSVGVKQIESDYETKSGYVLPFKNKYEIYKTVNAKLADNFEVPAIKINKNDYAYLWNGVPVKRGY